MGITLFSIPHNQCADKILQMNGRYYCSYQTAHKWHLLSSLFYLQWIFWPMWPGRSVVFLNTVLLVVAAIWTLPVSATSWEKDWASILWAAMDGLLESMEIPVVRVKSSWLLHRTFSDSLFARKISKSYSKTLLKNLCTASILRVQVHL